MNTFRARQTQEWWGREEFSAALALEGLGGVGRLRRGGGAWSRGCTTPSFAVAPYTVCMTTALLFLLITLRGTLAKGPRFLINTAAF